MEAEFIVASSTTQEAIRLRRFLRNLEVILHASGPITLFCGSMATIGQATNAIHHAKTKNIDVNFNFTRNRLEEVTLEYILLERMVAGLLAKPLDSTLFLNHVRALGLLNW